MASAVLLGGVLGPVALMYGLTTIPATSASLLLNLEPVFTALLAGFPFRENFDRRIAIGMAALALRHPGTARAGAHFSVAPFFGAALALLVQGEALAWQLVVAGVLMALGVWLHLKEQRGHEHSHELVEHSHAHSHGDLHHTHEHNPGEIGSSQHVHLHQHHAVSRFHPHYPDAHHRHPH